MCYFCGRPKTLLSWVAGSGGVSLTLEPCFPDLGGFGPLYGVGRLGRSDLGRSLEADDSLNRPDKLIEVLFR